MPKIKIIFLGLVAFVPRSDEDGNHTVEKITALLPTAASDSPVNKNLIQLFENKGQCIGVAHKNDKTFKHETLLTIKKGDRSWISTDLRSEEVEIKIADKLLSGRTTLQQEDIGSSDMRSVPLHIANLKDIYSDKTGISVNPKYLVAPSEQGLVDAGLAARLTFTGGTFAAYKKDLASGDSTFSDNPYTFYKSDNTETSYDSMAGAAIFVSDDIVYVDPPVITITIGNQPFSTRFNSDLEITIRHMPDETRNDLPEPNPGTYTDTDFHLIYEVLQDNLKATNNYRRIPNTSIPSSMRPPLLCGLALYPGQS